MCRRNSLEGVNYTVWSAVKYKKFGFAVCYFMRTLIGIKEALKMKIHIANGESIVYSASDFWPDSLPAFLVHRKIIGSKWIAALYLFAPNPFKGFRNVYKKGIRLPKLKELLYYLHQKPIYYLIKNKADMVFVTGEEDREFFISQGRDPRDVVTIRGGVEAKKAQERISRIGSIPKEYDACFVGRFHPQKGVLELIKIWKHVCTAKSDAKLAIIGADSPQYQKLVEAEIKRLNLTDRIELLGFMDGEEKHMVFLKSKIIVHPAVYDSGGMAACEGMAWGLPGVSFDLPALRTYYPKGVLKSPIGDIEAFGNLILSLLQDDTLYKAVRSDAIALALEWDWDKRAQEILNSIEAGL
jgi:glycosyltransferase involved in cell wall biosynthesis